MAGQLIPPPELRTIADGHSTPEQRVREWLQLLDTCEQFLLAGLRAKVGVNGDIRAAYRRWYEREWELRDQHRQRRLEELHQRRLPDAP